jgi:hypothetical protein
MKVAQLLWCEEGPRILGQQESHYVVNRCFVTGNQEESAKWEKHAMQTDM